ncbi:SDR family oxidoreductase [Pseudoglutamicibacter albus]|uniref:NAD(P)-dependent dehydrogenase (Short-subunit alcohol dehydrogenase family) n=1 Tax=Pseudoglutamicibacter albus TaxID=98671 RepID=A0ABU1Z1I1_9MICC|nr:SDR family oxidoreductase [Pseudoglutamicibacter albus]MDR7294475.1 NAD(P)-dependent dehydrogenase (short-subunit alcohol dehydrogenase family) [Pseudoglutamicibacter albus]
MKKTIVVTGASSGIGAQTAAQLLEAGHRVIGVDRNPPATANAGTATQSGAAPADAAQTNADAGQDFVQLDLSSAESIQAGVAQITELAGGPIDGLANIAGVPGTAPAEVVMAVNVLGLRDFTQALLPQLATGAGIVNLASSVAFDWRSNVEQASRAVQAENVEELKADEQVWALVQDESYLFSKQCVRLLTEKLAASLLQQKVRVNSVSPGPVSTPILEDFKTDHGREKVEGASKLLGKYGEVAEIADVIEFLLSDSARWVNGTDIRVDGGLVASRRSGNL